MTGKLESDVCDPNSQTQTRQIAVKWTERPDNCKDFFEARNIGLKWLYNWEEEGWSTYAAEDVKEANAIMEDILAILKGEGRCSTLVRPILQDLLCFLGPMLSKVSIPGK